MSETETEEQLLARHRKENRDLVATVTGLKKQATKSKKKEVQKKCIELEESLKRKHEEELKELRNREGGALVENGSDDEEDDEDEFSPEKLLAQLELDKKEQESVSKAKESTPQSQQQQQKGPKRNRQKERLAKRAAQIEDQKKQAEAEASLEPNLKEVEQEGILALCKLANVKEYDIKPDGNCLFASIADQLELRHGIKKTVQELRTQAANHIRNDPDTFTPYLFDEDTMTIKNIDEYTDKIEKTAAWGSDLEILALAKEYDVPVSIMMTGRSTLKINEDSEADELKLVYYKHSYALGEHYNSLHDA